MRRLRQLNSFGRMGIHGQPWGWTPASGLAPRAFSPSDIPGLLIWLTADDLGLADAAPVPTWPNKGSGSDFSQAIVGSRPTFRTAIQNGLGIVRFDGLNDFMLSDAVMSLAQPCTYYWISRRTGNFGAFNVGMSQNPEMLAIGFSPPANLWYVFSNPALIAKAAADNAFHLMTAQIDAATSIMRTDGVASAAVLDAGDVAADPWAIGATTGGAAPLAGDIGEILVYAGAHDVDQIALVEGYLNAKWAIF